MCNRAQPSNSARYVGARVENQETTVALVAELKQCANTKDFERGKLLHTNAIESGSHKNIYVASTLVSMYSKCGSMQDARDVFESMVHRNAVSWNALILGYVENGQSSIALDVFNSMDCTPNCITFVGALKACAGLANKKICLQKGVSVHIQASELGFDKDVFVANTLVDMYSKCGEISQARRVFDGITHRTVVSWTALILGYVDNKQSSAALEMFHNMDCAPNAVTFVGALKACAGLTKLQEGVSIHMRASELGYEKDVLVASTLVDMYSKCGDMLRARCVFNRMRKKNVVSWTSLILGYVENGQSSMALDVFNSMDCAPDCVTFVAALKACVCLGALETGQAIHDRVCELGLEQDQMVANCLVHFYGKCGNMAAAEGVFTRMHSRNTVSWNVLIGGYGLGGDTSQVFRAVERMKESGVQMDGVTMQYILTACGHAGKVEEAESYFGSMSKCGINLDVDHYACMVDILGRANRLEEALSLVRGMPFSANSVVWTALLGACERWSNVGIAEVAFSALLSDKGSVAAACVSMRNIYERAGGERIEGKRKTLKKQGRTYWCDSQGTSHVCVMGDKMEPQVKAWLHGIWGELQN